MMARWFAPIAVFAAALGCATAVAGTVWTSRVRQISAKFARFRTHISLQINELTLAARKSV
jgi:hypothetical protein